uniref:G0/G1 switch 2 n=1 Tax=Leptobrachium leishanense TaxID=445787 RepID=A0A8C5MII9_9ANUR
METIHELIPFAKEMLSQKPNRKMVKIYMLGSVLAFFGVVIGLVETVCSPFVRRDDTEENEKQSPVTLPAPVPIQKKELVLEKSKPQVVGSRSLANRGHAS